MEVNPSRRELEQLALEYKKLQPDFIVTGNEFGSCVEFGTIFSSKQWVNLK